MALLALSCAIAVPCTTGCRAPSPPVPLRTPQARVEVSHFVGSPLSGGVAAAHDTVAAPERVWGVRIVAFALESYPETVLESLAPHVQLVTRERGGDPLVPVTRVVRGRFGVVDDPASFSGMVDSGTFGQSARLMRVAAALAPGVTTTLRFVENPWSEDPVSAELRIWRVPGDAAAENSRGSVQIAFALEGKVEKLEDPRDDPSDPARDEDGDQEPVAERVRELESVREGILLRPWSLEEGSAIAFVFRFAFGTSAAESLAVLAEIRPRDEWTDAERAEFEPAVARCFEAIARADAVVRENRTGAIAEDLWPGLQSALEELVLTAQQRPALIYLAHATGARLVEELALSVEDELTGDLASSIRAAVAEESPADRASLAWLLTRASCEVLAARLAEDDSSADLEAVLVIHTGEVGRHAPVLEAVTRASNGLEDFRSRLTQENFTYLEDISPAARARALRWLTMRGLEPEGYDPLAPAKERRVALARAAEAAIEAATTEAAPATGAAASEGTP